ncbi:MAG TPA: hypothetical protein VHZ24_06265 [Pirellulales bacterium]|jgi:hypothetical protein|nr:hypothetical protein [Pirellulales bacterium]
MLLAKVLLAKVLFAKRGAFVASSLASLLLLSTGADKVHAGDGQAVNAQTVAADAFTTTDSQACYALALTPQAAKPAMAGHDVLVLFDTSASQVGAFRDKALETLNVVLSSLPPSDRVNLAAVDLQVIPLTSGFVDPRGSGVQAAIGQLRGRVPLGSTDMDLAMQSAADAFTEGGADRGRSVVYIGDGMSTAQLVGTARMHELVDRLIERRVAVSAYAVGPRLDAMLLGALASDTGGLLAVDNNDLTARQVGLFLIGAATGPVAWPLETKADESLGTTYPHRVAPLRFDRETIVLGRSPQPPSGQLHVTAEVGGQPVDMTWTVTSKPSDVDNAYLGELVQLASRDDAVSLPLVGTPGLRELRTMVGMRAQALARLGQQAVATGHTQQAQQLAAEALRWDAANSDAIAVDQAARRANPQPAGGSRDLRLINFQEAAAGGAAAPAGEELPAAAAGPAEGSFLNEVNQQRAVLTGRVQAEVQATINQARAMMGADPQAATNVLKLQLEGVRAAPELSPDIRLQLVDQLHSALREASRQAQVKAERDLEQAAVAAEAEQLQQINRELFDYQNKKSQLVERFDALMDEHRYADAEEVANTIRQEEPAVPVVLSGTQLTARQTKFTTDAQYMNLADHRGFLAQMHSIQLSSIPTPDDPPVIYPDADVWRLLSERRKKYRSVDLARNNPAEVKIIKALAEPTELEFIETPLQDVVEYLKTRHNIEIQLDKKALEEAALPPDTPVTRNLKGITLRSALRLMLRELPAELTYIIRDEVLLITSKTQADLLTTTKVYPVADLVIPIKVTNPLANGLGGGAGGGIGGAGGGGGGGMGGGGGGMGGGGFGGGGMFAVNEELRLSNKPVAAEKPAARAVPAESSIAVPAKPSGNVAPIKPIATPTGADADLQAAWDADFAAHQHTTAEVRETVRRSMAAGRPDQVIAVINAALKNDQGQPWMYEALGLAMQASGAVPADVERALMSALDMSTRPSDMIYVAEYMARAMPGNRPIELRALKLYRQASLLEPTRVEPLVQGLALAQRLNDLEGIQWTTVGILSQAWTRQQQEIAQLAARVATAAYEQLKAEGKQDEAAKFKQALDDAQVRDCVVTVSWTGEADIDLLVEEPSGAVCSFRNPRSTGGGVMLGDSTATADDRAAGITSESYICPQGFNGTYKMLLRRVWGKPTVNRVAVEYRVHRGSPQEKVIRKQISLVDGEAAVAFELQNGRRAQPLEQEQVANAVAGQLAVGKAILAQQAGQQVAAQQVNQQLNAISDPGVLGGYYGGGVGNFTRGAVGYQPVIITLPTGTNFSATTVVAADRRYVRTTATPFFSSIPQVNTFNYSAGSSGTSNGATGS